MKNVKLFFTGLILLMVSGCSLVEGEPKAEEIYPVLCPSIEAVSKGNDFQKKLIRETINSLENNVQDEETKKFLGYAKLFASEEDDELSQEGKKYLKETCANNNVKIDL